MIIFEILLIPGLIIDSIIAIGMVYLLYNYFLKCEMEE